MSELVSLAGFKARINGVLSSQLVSWPISGEQERVLVVMCTALLLAWTPPHSQQETPLMCGGGGGWVPALSNLWLDPPSEPPVHTVDSVSPSQPERGPFPALPEPPPGSFHLTQRKSRSLQGLDAWGLPGFLSLLSRSRCFAATVTSVLCWTMTESLHILFLLPGMLFPPSSPPWAQFPRYLSHHSLPIPAPGWALWSPHLP